MSNRVLLGEWGSDYGLWVSKPGGNVLSDADKDMLLSPEIAGMGQIIMFQSFSVSADATTTQNYNSRGGGKSFFNWWIDADYLGGTGNSNYNSGVGFSGVFLTVENKYINSTTNQIRIVNTHLSVAYSVLVMVVNQAAA